MKILWYSIIMVLLIFVPEFSYSQDSGNSAETNKVISAYNDFGIDVFSKLFLKNEAAFDSIKKERENILISPLSLALNMAIVYNGAEEETKSAIARTLHIFGINPEKFNSSNKELINSICLDKNSRHINIANAIWLSESKNWKFKEPFLNKIDDYYNASAFRGLNIDTINHWINEKTNGRIEDIDVKFDDLSAAVILNTIYFNDKWAYSFHLPRTEIKDFYLCDGSTKKIDMMKQVYYYNYHENDEFQEVEIKFRRDFGLVIFLPKNDRCLRHSNIKKIFKEFNEKSKRKVMGYIEIPKFKMKFETKPKDILSELGMGIAFDATKANFTEMVYFEPQFNLYIEEIIHSTFLKINEMGAEAAAATLTHPKFFATSRLEFKMIVNKPFYIVLRNTKNNTILFIGAVYDPQKITK